MTRPLRIQFAGAFYHVTSRGDRLCPIYLDDTDRLEWQNVLALVCERHHFVIHGFCQMGNHYHLLVETIEANLSQGMRQLNGLYTQRFNKRHEFVGHLFQGRYKAILVQKESYLLELHRYIVLNPVRAQLVASPDEWRWSSHHYLLDEAVPPSWLARDSVLSQLALSTLAQSSTTAALLRQEWERSIRSEKPRIRFCWGTKPLFQRIGNHRYQRNSKPHQGRSEEP